ncbi:MAG: hypothetical protein AAF214_09370 [Pseudomonadota bacterium]
MTHGLFPSDNPSGDALKRRKIKRHVVSEMDGTREGGLVFSIVFCAGFVLAAVTNSNALTSFWVWFALITMSIGVALAVQKAIAAINGVNGHDDEDGAL